MAYLTKIITTSTLLVFSLSLSFASGHFEFIESHDGIYCSVYYQQERLRKADVATFQRIGSIDSKYGKMDRFAKDKNYVFDGCHIRKGISPKGFDTLYGWDFVRTQHQVYYTLGNHNSWVRLKGLHPDHTIIEEVTLENGSRSFGKLIKDDRFVFYQHAPNRDPQIIPNADPTTFKLLSQIYAIDKNYVYYLHNESFKEHFKILQNIDPHHFKINLKEATAADNQNYYFYNFQSYQVEVFPKDQPLPQGYYVKDED